MLNTMALLEIVKNKKELQQITFGEDWIAGGK